MNPAHLSPVTVEQFYTDHAEPLKMRLVAGDQGLGRPIREATVNRPGLALAGFRKYFAPKRVQVIGNCETSYLRSLDRDLRLVRLPNPVRRGLSRNQA
jgi:HPr kinase/phosphorylase